MKNLVWLASYPKSGNTWIRSILSLAVRGQLDINDLIGPNFSSLVRKMSRGESDLTNAGDARLFWSEAQKNISEEVGAQNFFLKTHNIRARFDGIEFPLPDYSYKAIYIVRDPRDVAISYGKHFNHDLSSSIARLMDENNVTFGDGDLYTAELISSWGRHVESWCHASFPVLHLRYEDLLDDPLQSIPKILDFLNLEPAISVEEIAEKTSFKTLSGMEKASGFDEVSYKTDRFFRSGTSGQWKSEGPKAFASLMEKFEGVMRGRGYV